jgi:5-formyltetrahydrofolate cyclo-ligase
MTNQSNDTAADKGTIRSRLLAARRERAPHLRAELSRAACARLLDRAGDARVVAAYSSFGTEPDTGPLLAGLLERGVRVLLPSVLDDNDLAWGWYTGPDSLVRGNLGTGSIAEPADLLEPSAVLDADIVVLPGLAVDARGMRLGRGGGSYDRVLARIASAATADPAVRPWTVVMLYPDEVGVRVPAEAHDFPVDAAVTAEGTTSFG